MGRLRFIRTAGTNPAGTPVVTPIPGGIFGGSQPSSTPGSEIFPDIDGNLVPRTAGDFNERAHIPYERLR